MTSILWQNETADVTLIDVPGSIAVAQGTADTPCHDRLKSSQPLQSPFPSNNEPKSASAKAKLGNNTVGGELHTGYEALLKQALEQVRRHHKSDWCHPRRYEKEALPSTQKRKLDDDLPTTAGESCDRPAELPHDLCSKLARNSSPNTPCIRLIDQAAPRGEASMPAADGGFISNNDRKRRTLEVDAGGTTGSFPFHVPPLSSFYLGDCSDARPFHAAIRNQAQGRQTRRHFDFILLDPPWPSRSVKRTHRTPGSTYLTRPSLPDIRHLILGTDLDALMADDCLVGVWITNKPALRALVLDDEDGIFACWGVRLVEEWLWLKTTVRGEPVTALDASWRKPYEVLLLGRRRQDRYAVGWSPDEARGNPVRRVIIGVPDLHSRKPCVKDLVEPLIPSRDGYRALEVFARHLVAGWWSWGDECIKFNWDGCWDVTSTRGNEDGGV